MKAPGPFLFSCQRRFSKSYGAFGLAKNVGENQELAMAASEAIRELRARSEEMGRVVTSMHPWVPKLGDAQAQNDIFRALFELTKQVEVVKKQLLRLEKGDDSTIL